MKVLQGYFEVKKFKVCQQSHKAFPEKQLLLFKLCYILHDDKTQHDASSYKKWFTLHWMNVCQFLVPLSVFLVSLYCPPLCATRHMGEIRRMLLFFLRPSCLDFSSFSLLSFVMCPLGSGEGMSRPNNLLDKQFNAKAAGSLNPLWYESETNVKWNSFSPSG